MRKKGLLIALIVLVIFIWGNSCLPKAVSSQESGWVTALLLKLFGEGQITEFFVRKLAHFTEYAAFGGVLLLFMTCLPIRNGWRCLYGAMASMMIALVDETIQIFSGRGPMIQDVWLDFGGAVFGGGVAFLIWRASKKKKEQ